jgi:glutathione S-transferase
MSSLVFYYAPYSSAVTVHWVLEELGVPYEKVKIDLKARDQDKPSFRALNPNGKVPTLVVDGTPIFESIAITAYLGEMYGVEKKLYPAPGPKRGEVLKWMVWTGVSLGEAFSRHQRNSPQGHLPAEQRNEKALEAAKKDVEEHLGILEAELTKSPFLVGGAFTFADLYLASWGAYLKMTSYDMSKFPKVTDHINRCSARPAFGIAMAP